MKLAMQEVEAFRRTYKRIPLQVLAQRHGCTPLELCAAARRGGVYLEAQAPEIQYVIESIESKPALIVRRDLGMTVPQFQQLLQRLRLRASKPAHSLSLTEVTGKTRWLVESALRWNIDDELPRRISNEHFLDNRLFNLIEFATREKERDERFRGFPAVAYLVCTAYPGVFQPFQFRHAKGRSYFKGREGKRRLVNAVRWILEAKLGLKIGLLQKTALSKYFLRIVDLRFYGIPPNLYEIYFRTKGELIEALLGSIGVERSEARASSVKLRKILEAAGRAPVHCEIANCTSPLSGGLHIHHIIPKAMRLEKMQLHSASNLVALCPSHHSAAHDYPWHNLLKLTADERHRVLYDFISPTQPTTATDRKKRRAK
jgi:hypothetical protein